MLCRRWVFDGGLAALGPEAAGGRIERMRLAAGLAGAGPDAAGAALWKNHRLCGPSFVDALIVTQPAFRPLMPDAFVLVFDTVKVTTGAAVASTAATAGTGPSASAATLPRTSAPRMTISPF